MGGVGDSSLTQYHNQGLSSGLGFRVQGVGLKVEDLGRRLGVFVTIRYQGFGFRV